jgi:hypothetical protein
MSIFSFLNRHPESDLSALADGELSPERASAVEAHVLACPRCAGTLAALRETSASLAGLADVPAPRSFALTPEMAAKQTPPHRAAYADGRASPARLAAGMRVASAGLAVVLAVFVLIDAGGGDNGSGGDDSSSSALGLTAEFSAAEDRAAGEDQAPPAAPAGGDGAAPDQEGNVAGSDEDSAGDDSGSTTSSGGGAAAGGPEEEPAPDDALLDAGEEDGGGGAGAMLLIELALAGFAAALLAGSFLVLRGRES